METLPLNKFHLYTRYEDCQMLFCSHSQLEATFPFKLFCFPAIAVLLLFFWVTSVFAQRCAIGVMLRVCCVICCYGLYSRHVDPFSLLPRPSPSLSEEDQQPFHNNSQHSSKHCVMKLRKAASVLCVVWCFSFGTEKTRVFAPLTNLSSAFVWNNMWLWGCLFSWPVCYEMSG